MSQLKKIKKEANTEPPNIRFTTQLSLAAYDAISAIQRQYRTKTGRALPLWKVLDAAIIAYAKQHHINVEN